MASKRLEFIKLLLNEADDFLMKGNVIQSSGFIRLLRSA